MDLEQKLQTQITVEDARAALAGKIDWADDIVAIVKKNDYRPRYNVVSYELELGKGFAHYGFAKNPTFGWFGISSDEFPIVHKERITCLDGVLRFDVGQGIKEFTKGQHAIIPADINLKYDQKQQALYVCEYR